MRFAWLQATRGTKPARSPTAADRLALVAYNSLWWAPLALVLAGLISADAGLVAFLAISVGRSAVNLYRVNVLSVEKALSFPFRLP